MEQFICKTACAHAQLEAQASLDVLAYYTGLACCVPAAVWTGVGADAGLPTVLPASGLV